MCMYVCVRVCVCVCVCIQRNMILYFNSTVKWADFLTQSASLTHSVPCTRAVLTKILYSRSLYIKPNWSEQSATVLS